jgi:hypothetical protein
MSASAHRSADLAAGSASEHTHCVIFGGRAVAVAVAVLALGGCASSTHTAAATTAGGAPPSASASPAVHRSAPTSQPCRTRQLSVRLGVSGAGGGTAYRQVDFRNVSTTTCVLSGYPTVVFLDGTGRPVGHPAAPTNLLGTSIGPVELAPGQVGHASIGVTTAANYPAATCEAVTTSSIRISVPGDSAATIVHDRETVCSTNKVSTLVTPYRPGQPQTAVG